MAYFYYAGKRIFYTESGSGIPCVFLHGNTASSKMFQFILPLYEQTMGIVLLDFLGNGKSERVCRFPDELWIDQGMQVVTLCKALGYPKVNLVGTSGGAYAAINAALDAIVESLASEDKVQLVGFGAFEVKKRAERTGRNPKTKEPIPIPASQVPVFKPGKALKDAVNQ